MALIFATNGTYQNSPFILKDSSGNLPIIQQGGLYYRNTLLYVGLSLAGVF